MTEPIQTIINEFKTLGSDITNTVVFKMDGETLAACENTTPEQTQSLIDGINGITHANCIGGIENLTVQDINTQLSLTAVDSVYLATLSSRQTDQKIIKSLTRVVVPTVIRLSTGKTAVSSTVSQKKKKPQPKTKSPAKGAILPPELKPEIKPLSEPEAPPEPILPKAPSSQLMVERIGGLLVPSDLVRIDLEVVEKWRELFGDEYFSMVSVETLEGKTVNCRFRTKSIAKGIIQVPDRILRSLQTGKGKLVIVKPVIE
jgi:hypothetical protein